MQLRKRYGKPRPEVEELTRQSGPGRENRMWKNSKKALSQRVRTQIFEMKELSDKEKLL